ncbi:MAG: DUF3618 domain-containing protein [Pseudomonadota bacterium]|nr:DUF3618 domain-containing protein [Pseudomonadota bacterium]
MTDTTEDPAIIEREIRRTQDNMSRTVDKIGDQLSIKNLFNAVLDKADESGVDARTLVEGARRNPIALGLIAAGAIWLVSDKDSKLPSLPSKSDKKDDTNAGDFDVHHRDYVSHMSAIEQRGDEDMMTYQRRRDLARSNFLMVERGHEEDDSSFRSRLDETADKFREKRRAWAESSSDVQAAGKQKARAAAGKAQELYAGNPLVGGILAAAVGAAFGSALPVTRQERDKLGSFGEKARDAVSEQTEKVTAQVREKKDELLEKADSALQQSTGSTSGSGGSYDGEPAERQTPFLAGR